MSRYFVLPEDGIGPGGDITFRKGYGEQVYSVWVGETFAGQVCKLRAWAAVSWNKHPSEFFKVNNMQGFATRLDAATFIIKHHGYWMVDTAPQPRIE
jgi:hypothetical protein